MPISDPAKLPKSALELWQGYDARAEDLEVEIIEEWKTDEVKMLGMNEAELNKILKLAPKGFTKLKVK